MIFISYFVCVSFALVVIYLLFKNHHYTLHFDHTLFKVILYGILATIGAALISYSFEFPLNTLILPSSPFYPLIENFIIVAPLEELSKFMAVYIGTNRLRNLKQKEDLLFYLILSACIFSSIENLLYIFIYDNDFILALLRNFVSTPCHLFYSTILGFFYTLHLQHNTYKVGYFLQGLFFSTFFHGFINFCLCYYGYTHSLLGLIFGFIGFCLFYIVGLHLIKKHFEKALFFRDFNTQWCIYCTWFIIVIFLLILIFV